MPTIEELNQGETIMLIVAGLDGDPEVPFVAVTTPGGNAAQAVRSVAGDGCPFYVFANNGIPFAYQNGIVVDFTGAPLCDTDDAVNNTSIIAMLEMPPLDKISAP